MGNFRVSGFHDGEDRYVLVFDGIKDIPSNEAFFSNIIAMFGGVTAPNSTASEVCVEPAISGVFLTGEYAGKTPEEILTDEKALAYLSSYHTEDSNLKKEIEKAIIKFAKQFSSKVDPKEYASNLSSEALNQFLRNYNLLISDDMKKWFLKAYSYNGDWDDFLENGDDAPKRDAIFRLLPQFKKF